MEKILKRRPVGMVILALGAVLLMLTVVQSGSSFFSPRAVTTIAEVETVSSNGGGAYRPFTRTEFVYSTFSGLYLSDDDGSPAVWVMWGVLEDGWVCFYLPADGKDINGDGIYDTDDAPADQWNVEFILRAAQGSYHEHSRWVLEQSIADNAAYYDVDESEIKSLFADGVLETGRAALLVTRIAFGVGIFLLILGAALLMLPPSVDLTPWRRPVEEPDTDPEELEPSDVE